MVGTWFIYHNIDIKTLSTGFIQGYRIRILEVYIQKLIIFNTVKHILQYKNKEIIKKIT